MQSVAAAYSNTAKMTPLPPRELEATLLLKGASKLQRISDSWPAGTDQVDDALQFNRKLWVILTTSATDRNNPLPDAIKQNIGNLGIFILNQIIRASAEPAPERFKSIIAINTSLAAGLRGE